MINLSKKDNNHVTQFSVVVHVHSKKALFVTLIGVMDRKEDHTGRETSRVKTFKESKLYIFLNLTQATTIPLQFSIQMTKV